MAGRIPPNGIVGTVALREAAAGDYRDIMALVQRALAERIYPGRQDAWVLLEALYVDRAVVARDGRYFAYAYTIADTNVVTLGESVEVARDFLPVKLREAQGAGTAFLEAHDPEAGTRWRIRVIQAGLSGNSVFYPDAVLREAAPLFEGVRVFEKADIEHLKGDGKSIRNLIGRITNVQFVEGAKTDTGELQADLELLQSAGDTPAKLREAYQRGMSSLFGFSIDADGRANKKAKPQRATAITKVNSVDLIIEPGAGGQLIHLIESLNPEAQTDMALRTRMIEAIKKANKGSLPQGLDTNDDEALETAYREALNTHHDAASAGGGNRAAPHGGMSREEVTEQLRMVEARGYMRATLGASNLPDAAKDKLRKQFDATASFKEADVDAAVTGEREYLAKFTESGRVTDLGGGRVETVEGQGKRLIQMLDDFFAGKPGAPTSFKECYVAITGDKRLTGELRDCDRVRLREAVGEATGFREALDSGSWANVLGSSITRRMVADYRTPTMYDAWRRIVTVVPVGDFRLQERTRVGGYGDLPIIAEKQPYGELASPGDEKATYQIQKRGGTESVSMEMIRNDDVGAIRRVPTNLSRAAKRTLGKFVFDFIRLNPPVYDTKAWFHADHANLGSAALAPASLAAGRLAMLKQTELGSGEQVGIPPRFLLVPADLEETGFDLFRRTTNNDSDFVESLQMQVIPVWYWADANDWALMADPLDIPTIELGFLDGNEEPELFVQDSPTSGSLFANDTITYKLRHTYGGNITDLRGGYKAVVA